ncbi:hypothetical protein J2X16_005043 [Pelomonas aquatica]|uniref:Uncharacterized protein n=1 Tax=Pelomonas aquatica TaxID=431058 RepID=A0ABU1ZGB0_9BURK|nr:hypothetical protein [Pelomonas aquatica]
MHNKNRAWRGQPKKFDLVCLFVPDYFSVRRLDGGAVIGDVGHVLGPSGQRAMERMLSSASGVVTKRQWRSQAALLKRLVRECPDSVSAEFAAWFGPQLDLGSEARLDPPMLSWDMVRLARPDWVGETERRLQDHWALLQRRGQVLLAELDLDARLAAGDGADALRDVADGIRSDPILLPYWSEASLVHLETTGTQAAIDQARAAAFVQALVSQLGLVQALQEEARPDIDAMVELDRKRGWCNPGGALLRAVREAFALPTLESLVAKLQTAGCRGPDRSTLMAWSSGRQFPSSKLWGNLIEALRSPSDPEFLNLPSPLRQGTLGWAARRVHGLHLIFGQCWSELKPFIGEAESLAGWLGPSVSRWHQHWVAQPLPHVEPPKLPLVVR